MSQQGEGYMQDVLKERDSFSHLHAAERTEARRAPPAGPSWSIPHQTIAYDSPSSWQHLPPFAYSDSPNQYPSAPTHSVAPRDNGYAPQTRSHPTYQSYHVPPLPSGTTGWEPPPQPFLTQSPTPHYTDIFSTGTGYPSNTNYINQFQGFRYIAPSLPLPLGPVPVPPGGPVIPRHSPSPPTPTIPRRPSRHTPFIPILESPPPPAPELYPATAPFANQPESTSPAPSVLNNMTPDESIVPVVTSRNNMPFTTPAAAFPHSQPPGAYAPFGSQLPHRQPRRYTPFGPQLPYSQSLAYTPFAPPEYFYTPGLSVSPRPSPFGTYGAPPRGPHQNGVTRKATFDDISMNTPPHTLLFGGTASQRAPLPHYQPGDRYAAHDPFLPKKQRKPGLDNTTTFDDIGLGSPFARVHVTPPTAIGTRAIPYPPWQPTPFTHVPPFARPLGVPNVNPAAKQSLKPGDLDVDADEKESFVDSQSQIRPPRDPELDQNYPPNSPVIPPRSPNSSRASKLSEDDLRSEGLPSMPPLAGQYAPYQALFADYYQPENSNVNLVFPAKAPSRVARLKLNTKRYLTDDIPRGVYSLLLLQIPSLYFSRVAQIFEEADLGLGELKQMVLQMAATRPDYKVPFRIEAEGMPKAFKNLTITWENFIDSVMREWKTFNIISALLLSAILTILQIDSAATDALTRYTALASLVCALTSLLYGCIYIVRFGTMKDPHRAAEWALEAKKTDADILWNVWVMLAMPAVWLSWSLILYICCIMSFLWRTHPHSNDLMPISSRWLLAIRVAISVLLGFGLVYGILVIATFRRYGAVMDEAWKQRTVKWLQSIYAPPPLPNPHLNQAQGHSLSFKPPHWNQHYQKQSHPTGHRYQFSHTGAYDQINATTPEPPVPRMGDPLRHLATPQEPSDNSSQGHEKGNRRAEQPGVFDNHQLLSESSSSRGSSTSSGSQTPQNHPLEFIVQPKEGFGATRVQTANQPPLPRRRRHKTHRPASTSYEAFVNQDPKLTPPPVAHVNDSWSPGVPFLFQSHNDLPPRAEGSLDNVGYDSDVGQADFGKRNQGFVQQFAHNVDSGAGDNVGNSDHGTAYGIQNATTTQNIGPLESHHPSEVY